MDDGILSFKVLQIIDESNLRVQAVNSGYIASHKGVNLPNTDVDLPPCPPKT